VQPARTSGLLGFDLGIAATMLKVDTNASYWQRAVPRTSDFVRHGYVGVPRLVVSKGFGAGSVSASYAKVSDTGIKTYGGALDLPVIRGSVTFPELAMRASYATLTGIDVLKLKTYGLELFVSKGIGPVTPYGAVGRMRSVSRGTIHIKAGIPDVIMADRSTVNRYTLGMRLSFFIPKFAIEATQAEQRSYAAKVSVGF
jgi:hypothetical protein